MSLETDMKWAEKLASLFNRRAEALRELTEIDDEIDRVQGGRGCAVDHTQTPGRSRQEGSERE